MSAKNQKYTYFITIQKEGNLPTVSIYCKIGEQGYLIENLPIEDLTLYEIKSLAGAILAGEKLPEKILSKATLQ